jgi:hypothetical protein
VGPPKTVTTPNTVIREIRAGRYPTHRKTQTQSRAAMRHLFGWSEGSRAKSVARQSIARTLQRQRKLEHLWSRQKRSHCFEHLVAAARVGSSHSFSQPRPSCGNTMNCWASVFLRQEDINKGHIYSLISGGLFVQARNQLNLVAFSLLHALATAAGRTPPHGAMLVLQRYFQRSAAHAVEGLRSVLLAADEDADLPRVFFCSTTWVAQGLSLPLRGVDEGMRDHDFALVKRSVVANGTRVLEFQLVQGYSDSIDYLEPENGAPGAGERGFWLLEWQSSGHPFALPSGFDADSMDRWLSMLTVFATSQTWEASNFANMFGNYEHRSKGASYWPAVSFRELTDDAIVGWGVTQLLDDLEAEVDSHVDCSVPETGS